MADDTFVPSGDAGYTARLRAGGTALTRWSHGHRLAAALAVLEGRRFEQVADVGGADGSYLVQLVDAGVAAAGTVVDVDAALLEVGRAEASRYPTVDYVLSTPEALEALRGRFDLVVCMETLEHVPDPAAVIDDVVALARPGAALLVSVPVEVGPALLVKQAGRWFANRKGGYGYGRYPWGELVAAGVAFRTDGIDRENLHSHKGFDYRRARSLLADRATIKATHWSPVRFLGPLAASTVTWLARAG